MAEALYSQLGASRRRTKWPFVLGTLLVALLLAGIWYALLGRPTGAQQAATPPPLPSLPVTAAVATTLDVPLNLRGIGTVQALNTVTIRSRVDGELQQVAFTEGQEVKAGDILAQIDPRPFQAALDQATAKKAQDEAQLANAQRDLNRYLSLAQRDFASRQQADTQNAMVAQIQAQLKGDQAAIDNAQIQLSYTTIRSPIDGRVGFRLVDPGNIVRSTDADGLAVITQERPIAVVFSLPEDQLGAVTAAMTQGPLSVSVATRDNTRHRADGTLQFIDNQIDPSTGTIRLKAEFANADGALWPGQFVTVRLLLRTDRQVLTVPSTAVQRGAQGLYAYVVKPDDTVDLRWLTVDRLNRTTAIVTAGLQEGERVVTAGQLRLQPGAHVDARVAEAPAPAGDREPAP
jgi:membrane fusion protein, multidrug efflux system